MTEQSTVATHEYMKLLLPWYANGTLSLDERSQLVQHLEICGECREDLAVLQQVQNGVKRISPAPLVPEPQVERFMAQLDSGGGTKSRLLAWRPLAAAAALVAALAIAMLATFNVPDTNRVMFETATSSDGQPRMDYVLSVTLEPGTTDGERLAVFERMGANAGYETLSPGVYRIVVSLPATSLPELQSYSTSVEKLPHVEKVEPVALQLPVERVD